jgi:hypothetical protein
MTQETEVLWTSDDYRIVPASNIRWAGARKVHELRLEQRRSSGDWSLVAYVEHIRWPYFDFHSKATAIAYLQGYARCRLHNHLG